MLEPLEIRQQASGSLKSIKHSKSAKSFISSLHKHVMTASISQKKSSYKMFSGSPFDKYYTDLSHCKWNVRFFCNNQTEQI